MIIWVENNKLEGIWKEVIVTSFKEQSWHLPGRTEENHKNQSG
jgi:hypothetical protein